MAEHHEGESGEHHGHNANEKNSEHHKADESCCENPDHEQHKHEHHTGGEKSIGSPMIYALIILIIGIIIYNQIVIGQITSAIIPVTGAASASSTGNALAQPQLTGDAAKDAISIVISKGVPPIYGPELGVSFDKPVDSMNVLKKFDPTYGSQKIVLQGDELKRYIKVLNVQTLACEFCCSAKTIIDSSGRATCGCAHSWAMRGLTAYLIKNHGSEYTDDQIRQQVAKWKSLFFPKQMVSRFNEEVASGQYTPDIAALLLGVDTSKLKDFKPADVSSSIQNAPNMVGGC